MRKSCVRNGVCLFVFFEERRHTSSAAAEFPGKSEHIQKEKEGGWRVRRGGIQINKCVGKGRGAGKRIRREEGKAVRRKREKRGRVSGSKMLTPGCSLAADRRRMWAGFWVAIKSL